MNFKNIFSVSDAKPSVIFFSLVIFNFILLFPSFFIPFFGDDFAWMLQAKNTAGASFTDFISSPAPFGYFRPVSKIFFWTVGIISGYSTSAFRISIILLHIVCSFLVYKLTVELKYKNETAILSALIFSVLACHAETLFFVNCVNEIFSAIFILSGLCLLPRNYSLRNSAAIVFCFLLALLSRESAICYLPLIFLVNYKTRSLNLSRLISVSLIPVIFYLIFRLYAEFHSGNFNMTSLAGSIDSNPLKFIYKILHYFINMMLPVKSFFEFTGFDSMELLINAFRSPADNLLLFSILLMSAFLITSLAIRLLGKTLKSESIFPVLFILASLFIYLLSKNTAERFLYLPSAGMSLLLALFISKLANKKIAAVTLMLFVLIHIASLLNRAFRYIEASEYSEVCMNDLYKKTDELVSGDKVLLQNLPPKKAGIFFLSIPNIQPNWDYNFPDKKINFTFDEIKTAGDKINAVYKFNNEKSEFERVK